MEYPTTVRTLRTVLTAYESNMLTVYDHLRLYLTKNENVLICDECLFVMNTLW